jgi:hypothetical protein
MKKLGRSLSLILIFASCIVVGAQTTIAPSPTSNDTVTGTDPMPPVPHSTPTPPLSSSIMIPLILSWLAFVG